MNIQNEEEDDEVVEVIPDPDTKKQRVVQSLNVPFPPLVWTHYISVQSFLPNSSASLIKYPLYLLIRNTGTGRNATVSITYAHGDFSDTDRALAHPNSITQQNFVKDCDEFIDECFKVRLGLIFENLLMNFQCEQRKHYNYDPGHARFLGGDTFAVKKHIHSFDNGYEQECIRLDFVRDFCRVILDILLKKGIVKKSHR